MLKVAVPITLGEFVEEREERVATTAC
jgi:hypothetical protein